MPFLYRLFLLFFFFMHSGICQPSLASILARLMSASAPPRTCIKGITRGYSVHMCWWSATSPALLAYTLRYSPLTSKLWLYLLPCGFRHVFSYACSQLYHVYLHVYAYPGLLTCTCTYRLVSYSMYRMW